MAYGGNISTNQATQPELKVLLFFNYISLIMLLELPWLAP